MGRYGPPAYVTDRSGEILAQALEQAGSNLFGGIERGRERRRLATHDAEASLDRSLRLYDAGVRTGAAPSGDVTLPGIDRSQDLSFPDGHELARHLSIGASAAEPSAAGSGEGLASALPSPAITTNQPAPMTPGFGRSAAPPPVAGHPGAFDPATGSFRNGQGMAKPKTPPIGVMKNDRYAQIDDTHYLDRAETPEARREGEQLRGQQLAREFATGDRERKITSIMSAYQIPRARAEVLVDNPGIADNALYPTSKTPPAKRTQLVRNKAGAYVAVDLDTGLGPDGKPVEGYDAPRTPLTPREGAATAPKPTEFSNKAALVYPRAAAAAEVLSRFYESGAPVTSKLSKVPGVGNYMLSDEEQAMNTAAETVSSAILRLESGAAISESEIKSLAKQLLPQPGDSKAVLAQKRANLLTQIEAMEKAAAPSITAPRAPGAGSGDTRQGVELPAKPPAAQNPWRR